MVYGTSDEAKIVRPDFICFTETQDGRIVADVVDPHGIQLADALPKLKGLAHYAATQGDSFRQIESVAKVGDTFRALDLTEALVREKVSAAHSAKALFESDAATDYLL